MTRGVALQPAVGGQWGPAVRCCCSPSGRCNERGLCRRAALFLKHIVAWMSMPKCNDKIRSTWVGYWTQVDAGLGERVKKQLAEALRSS